jgi:hypothetical protein
VHPKVERAYEEIDVMVYNGDALEDEVERIRLKELCQTWLAKINEIEVDQINDSITKELSHGKDPT